MKENHSLYNHQRRIGKITSYATSRFGPCDKYENITKTNIPRYVCMIWKIPLCRPILTGNKIQFKFIEYIKCHYTPYNNVENM